MAKMPLRDKSSRRAAAKRRSSYRFGLDMRSQKKTKRGRTLTVQQRRNRVAAKLRSTRRAARGAGRSVATYDLRHGSHVGFERNPFAKAMKQMGLHHRSAAQRAHSIQNLRNAQHRH